MSADSKPYHEMSLAEYASTAHSQAVPKWSILAMSPDEYTVSSLCRLSGAQLRALAFLWDVRREGSKEIVANRIIKRHHFRRMLSEATEESLASRPRKELASIAQEAGIYHPWLNRREMARQLTDWRRAGRERVRIEIAKARHERVVQKAARSGHYVPPENLERYGFDAHGEYEPMIFGVPQSRASRTAPEAIAVAKELSKEEFVAWIKANPGPAARLVFIEPGILGDGGSLFWKIVQAAAAPADVPSLFAGL